MAANISLNNVAGLIGDPARASMLVALVDGRARTAGELSMIAGISAQNASGHLLRLMEGALIAVEVQGRHRYYRLSNADVAHALESLAAISSTPNYTRPESPQLCRIRLFRTCYDHLAGRIAVDIAASLLAGGFLEEDDRNFLVTSRGEALFSRLGIGIASLRAGRRAFARRCLDWTERKPHIGGSLGAAILLRFKDLKWAVPIRQSRAMRVTAVGARALRQQLGINVSLQSETQQQLARPVYRHS